MTRLRASHVRSLAAFKCHMGQESSLQARICQSGQHSSSCVLTCIIRRRRTVSKG